MNIRIYFKQLKVFLLEGFVQLCCKCASAASSTIYGRIRHPNWGLEIDLDLLAELAAMGGD